MELAKPVFQIVRMSEVKELARKVMEGHISIAMISIFFASILKANSESIPRCLCYPTISNPLSPLLETKVFANRVTKVRVEMQTDVQCLRSFTRRHVFRNGLCDRIHRSVKKGLSYCGRYWTSDWMHWMQWMHALLISLHWLLDSRLVLKLIEIRIHSNYFYLQLCLKLNFM